MSETSNQGPEASGDVAAAMSGDLSGEFVRYLGVDFLETTGERVVATWTAGPHLHQPYGIVHGGAHCSVFETLASVGAAVWWGDRGHVVGVNNNTDFYRAVREGAMRSTATPVHQGRSQQVWVVETVGEDGRGVAPRPVRLHNQTA
jgi:1,4-dihydroxy-2-naphthoyl-CoA hydrolase